MSFGKKELQILAGVLILMGVLQYFYAGYGDFSSVFRRGGSKVSSCLKNSNFYCVRKIADNHIKKHPNDAIGYYYRGLADAGDWSYPSAVEYFSQAIEIDKNYRDAYFERAKALFILSDTQAALADLDVAISLDKYRPDFYELRAEYLLSVKRYKDALNDYERAAKLYRNVSNKIASQRVNKEAARIKEQYQL